MSKGEKGFLALTIAFMVFIGMREAKAKANLNGGQRVRLSQIAQTLEHTSQGDLIELTDHRLLMVTHQSYDCSIRAIEGVGGTSHQRSFCSTMLLLDVEKVITPQDSDYAPRLVAFVRGNQ